MQVRLLVPEELVMVKESCALVLEVEKISKKNKKNFRGKDLRAGNRCELTIRVFMSKLNLDRC